MISKYRRLLATLIFGFVLLLPGCFLFRHAEITRNTPEALYQQGVDNYQEGKYKKAIEAFERLKESFPLSPFSILAELGIGDANFSNKEYIAAESAYSDFVNLHPTNENLPYVLYQIGMCHYNQMFSIDRDQTETKKAQTEFEKLIARFPGSKFAFLGEKRLSECKARIAEHEFYVGEFYFNIKKYKAALKRFQGIIKNYPNLGLDYKVDFYIATTQKRIMEEEEKEKIRQEREKMKKEKEALRRKQVKS